MVASSVHISAPASMPLMRSSQSDFPLPVGQLLDHVAVDAAASRVVEDDVRFGADARVDFAVDLRVARRLIIWPACVEGDHADAPEFQQSITSRAISSGCVGRRGFCFLLAIPPVGAMVMITLFELIGFSSRVAIG